MPLRRKKWCEEEERTLIDKYAVMLADGTLSKLKTREKRFKPIAAYVNMMHHERDPVAFPWQWTWKDVSTKVQNMRHQYLGVKQKIKKSVVAPDQGGASAGGDPGQEEYDWIEGLSRWSNFLRYKDVFGDVVSEADDSFSGDDPRGCTGMNDGIRSLSSLMDALGPSLDADLLRDGIRGIDGGSDLLGLALGSDYDGENGDGENQLKEDGEAFEFENSEAVELGKKRKRLVKNGRSGKDSSMVEQRLWEFLVNQIAQFREREARLEGRRYERPKREQFRGAEGKRRLEGREKGRGERDQNWERSSHERVRDWDTMEKESAERERRRREEDMLKERECEEKMEKRREEWKKRMDDMLRQHRVEMEQLQGRIMQDQQNVMNQLLGLFSQWTGHSTGLPRMKGQLLSRAPSVSSSACSKRSDLRLLLGVMGAPLAPVHVSAIDPLPHLSIKDTPIETSSAQYILQQYTAASGGLKLQSSIRNAYAMGKLKMVASEFETATKVMKNKNPSRAAETGGFVLWQMMPDMWYVELAVGGSKVHAGCNGKLVWRHTPWLGAHAAKGPVRPLRRALQGLDPRTTASMFADAKCIGEKQINGEECFILKLFADPQTLKARSEGPAEIIRHVLFGYFSQRTGLLVHMEDSHLTRIQSNGGDAVYWETTINSFLEDYRPVEGVMIAHSGRSVVTLFRFGEMAMSHTKTRMEEVWTIEEVVFNVPGLSMDCFIPPADIRCGSIGEACELPRGERGKGMAGSHRSKVAALEKPQDNVDNIIWRVEV